MPKYLHGAKVPPTTHRLVGRRFFTDTHLSESERQMMTPPTPRGVEDNRSVCSRCNYGKNTKGGLCKHQITINKCPYLMKRLAEGNVDRRTAFNSVKKDQHHLPIQIFVDEKHRKRFESLQSKLSYPAKGDNSVLVIYLLSATDQLAQIVLNMDIAELCDVLESIPKKGLSIDSYNLLCTAKDSLLETNYGKRCDYTNEEIVPHSISGFYYASLFVKRYGIGFITPAGLFLR